MLGRTTTRALEFETRQYNFMDFDLGEGIPRTMMIMGGGLLAIWITVLWALFGPPTPTTLLVYFTIPAIVVFFAFQEDPARPRRKRIAGWVHRVRYAVRGHRPFVSRTLSKNRDDILPVSYRFGIAQVVAALRGRGEVGVWDTSSQDAPHPYTACTPLRVHMKARIIPNKDIRHA